MRRLAPVLFCILVTACAASSAIKKGDVYEISALSSAWVLEFPADSFELQIADNSIPYYMFTDGKTNINVSFNFEPAAKCKSSEECRNYLATRMRSLYPKKKNWAMSRTGEVFISENMDGEEGGLDLRQQHMNAHYVKGGIWIDVHLSKVNYKKSDRELFLKFIHSIRFKPRD